MTSPAPKEIPRRLAELRVPNDAYHYFQWHHAVPFAAAAPGFDLGLAWWLSEVSYVSYLEDQGAVADRLLGAGFDLVRFHEHRSIRAMVIRRGEDGLVCFRGTRVAKPRNIVTDLEFKQTEWDRGGRVHRGFRRALDAVWPTLANDLEDSPRAGWLFAGHSLGGALALLAASRSGEVRSAYSFGTPRVGDREFARAIDFPCHRVVHADDVVTDLPPRPRFAHAGSMMRILPDGSLGADVVAETRSLRRHVLDSALGADGVRDLIRTLATENALADHSPVLYAVKLWNALLRSTESRRP